MAEASGNKPVTAFVAACVARYGDRPMYVNFHRRKGGAVVCYWYPKRGTRAARWHRAQWCRLPGDPSTAIFWHRYIQLRESFGLDPLDTPADLKRLLRPLHEAPRRRAATKSLPHEITLAGLVQLYVGQNKRCAVSGLRFHFNGTDDTMFSRAFAPSLDRIDNSKGYTFGNVRLVCRIANFAMGTWGQKALEELAIGVVKTAGHRLPDEQVCNTKEGCSKLALLHP